ncbi:MAG: RebB family R body protein [Myxococcales bacterium]|nr:RebB family R body protein [Myxococcales bacterium]
MAGVAELVGDAVAGDVAVIGLGPAAAMAALDAAAADSTALAMQNATAQQQRVQVTSTAALAITLARILSAPAQKGSSP